jgi:hypothetical protein
MSFNRDAVSELARESSAIAFRSTVPYRFDEYAIIGLSSSESCMPGTFAISCVDDRFRPGPGRPP